MPSSRKTVRKPRRSAGRPKQEDVAVLEDWLLSVALKEFIEHGYGATSLSRIVKLARISKVTLYSRFSSKEELFRAIMQQQIDRLDPGTMLVPDSSRPDLAGGLKAYANRMLEFSLRGEFLEVNRLLSNEAHRFPELSATAAERNASGVKRIAQFISECGTSDGVPCKDAEAVAEAFICMIRGWYTNVMLTNRPVSVARRKDWVERTVQALIAGRAGW